MTFMELLDKNIKREEEKLREYKRELASLTEGKLVRRMRNGSPEYYMSCRGTERYIRKKEYWLVNELKRRKVLEKTCQLSKSNIAAQRTLLNSYEEVDLDRIRQELPERYHGIEVTEPEFNAGEQRAEEDGKQFFRQSENEYKRDELVNSTYFGLKTRSKSEALIAEALYRNGFSLYYEKKLFLVDAYGNPRTMYPDFTIPIGRKKIMYWEHKGLLDSDEYLMRDSEKTRLYHLNNIYTPYNLIVTSERQGGGIDNKYIEFMVKGFLGEMQKNI